MRRRGVGKKRVPASSRLSSDEVDESRTVKVDVTTKQMRSIVGNSQGTPI
ncbi:hypothetical protein [Sulfuracidifex tepidarius]|uniref:Uncharacterized protein n=1 Tax=Sulfuracidifex tepidarius TaxID=1294262 RepID=A0A510E0W9_9CREN|nr:hypothetical protein [Sulfuracidifex tepidarius]BBG26135.1 hypothetical protein IC007_0640 [Sulfuracidifex tepidarius]